MIEETACPGQFAFWDELRYRSLQSRLMKGLTDRPDKQNPVNKPERWCAKEKRQAKDQAGCCHGNIGSY